MAAIIVKQYEDSTNKMVEAERLAVPKTYQFYEIEEKVDEGGKICRIPEKREVVMLHQLEAEKTALENRIAVLDEKINAIKALEESIG